MVTDPLVISVRCIAEVTGLQSRDDLNGKLVRVLEYVESAGRWAVEVLDAGENFRCKAECLIWRKPLALSSGCVALIGGLESRADLNGQFAFVREHDKTAGRWAIEVFGTKEAIRCKGECLVPQVAVGCVVEIIGLESRADLNGKLAKVCSFDKAAGRWVIQLLETQETMRCRFECLKGPTQRAAEEEAIRKAVAEEAARKAAEEAKQKVAAEAVRKAAEAKLLEEQKAAETKKKAAETATLKAAAAKEAEKKAAEAKKKAAESKKRAASKPAAKTGPQKKRG